jgi:hypothetical protein
MPTNRMRSLGGGGEVKGGGVAFAGGDEGFDIFYGFDVASGAYGGAVEGGGGAGEVELTLEGPVLEHAVDEACVEGVSGAGSVLDGYMEGGGVVEGGSVIGQDALRAEGGGGEAATVAGLHEADGLVEIGLVHEARGEIATDNEVVDLFEQSFDAGVDLVQVGDDRHAGLAGPGGGEGGGGDVISIDVKCAGVDDPFTLEVVGVQVKALVLTPEDGSFADGIDQDEGLAGGAVGDGDDADLDAGVREGFAMEGGGDVIAEGADVASLEAPLLAGDDCGGDLPAGEDAGGTVLDLGAGLGEVGEGDDGVGGVEPNSDQVDLGKQRHGSSVTLVRIEK